MTVSCFLSFLQQSRGVRWDVLHERADVCERAHPDPTGTAVSGVLLQAVCRCCGYHSLLVSNSIFHFPPHRWESSSQSLRLHLLQLKTLNRSIVRDGYKVWVLSALMIKAKVGHLSNTLTLFIKFFNILLLFLNDDIFFQHTLLWLFSRPLM